jgi:hypothetical protein
MGTLADATDYVRALYYGPYGSGKTTNAARMARLGRVACINIEGGLKKVPLTRLGVPIENIEVVDAKTYDELDNLFWQMKSDLDDDPTSWVGVVLDSGSELVARFLNDVRKTEYAKVVKKAERRGEEATQSPFFTDRAYYGEVTGMVSTLVREFLDLPCHFAITALPRRDEDDDGRITYGPAVNPALQDVFTGLVDVVGYCEAADGVYTARFMPTRTKQAKDRFGVLPHVMQNAYFDQVAGIITGDVTYSPAPADDDNGEVSAPRRRRRAQ